MLGDKSLRKDEMLIVVVLNDGETFTGLEGCRVIGIPAYLSDDIDRAVKDAHAAEAGIEISRLLAAYEDEV